MPAFASLKSMTAYGRASLNSSLGHFLVEIQSVNRRHLELSFSLPKALGRFEMEMRKWLEEKIVRGHVSILLSWRGEKESGFKVRPNLALAKEVYQAWKEIYAALGIVTDPDPRLLSHEKGLLVYEEAIAEDDAVYSKQLRQLFDEALASFSAMREKEGAAIAKDLSERLENLHVLVRKIQEKAPTAVSKHREKLGAKLEELFSGHPENEEKLIREVALLAEKVDITEEVVRFKSHLDQFAELLEKPLTSPQEARGKTFDFMIQELLRETNTMGSKSADSDVTAAVIAVKAELEKMREQIQNLE